MSQMLGEHYSRTFAAHGEKPQGVDWGPCPEDHLMRLERMLAVADLGIGGGTCGCPTLLDVGCGYGSLLGLIQERGQSFDYHGIDLCEAMIQAAKARFPGARWSVEDVLLWDPGIKFDYVVCNGILTQKLGATIREMDEYAKDLITKGS